MHRLIKTCLFNLSRFIAASQMSRLPHLQTEDSSMFGIQRATAGSSVQIGCCFPGPCCRSPWGNTTASCSHRVSLFVVKKAPLSFMLHHCISSQMLLSFRWSGVFIWRAFMEGSERPRVCSGARSLSAGKDGGPCGCWRLPLRCTERAG